MNEPYDETTQAMAALVEHVVATADVARTYIALAAPHIEPGTERARMTESYPRWLDAIVVSARKTFDLHKARQ